MSEHNAPDRPPGKGDFEAVRAALLRLDVSEAVVSSEEVPEGEGRRQDSQDTARGDRRALVDELVDVLGTREDLIHLQVQHWLDPLEPLTSHDSGWATGRDL